MNTHVDEFMDSILSRLSNGPMLNENELLKIINDVENKIANTREQIKDAEREINKEIESLTHEDCCHADPLALQCFLNNVVQATERYVGQEDHILSELIKFCERNYLSLPSFGANRIVSNESRVSLNTCVDESEEQTREIWQQIHTKLKNGVLKLLRGIPTGSKNDCTEHTRFQHEKRQRLLDLLGSLYSFADVWHMYCGVRDSQLDAIKPSESSVNGSRVASVDIDKFKEATEKHLIMINEDIELLLLYEKEQKEVTSLNELADVYSQSMRHNIDHFLRNYRLLQKSHSKIPGLVGVTQLFEKATQDFSVSNIRTFAKLFSLLEDWSCSLKRLVTESSNIPCQKESSFSRLVCDENETEQVSMLNENDLWNWEGAFQPYIKILTEALSSYIHCILNLGGSNASATSSFPRRLLVPKKNMHHGDKRPMQVSEECGSVIVLLSEIVVFMKYDQSPILKNLSEAVTCSLVESLTGYSSSLQKSISLYAEDGKKINAEHLARILCDVAFIKNQLVLWEKDCGDDNKTIGRFNYVIKCFEETANDCSKWLIKYHLYVIKSSLVYDVHSNNWEEDRYFYEGERCSFPVHMWNIYIRGVVHDLYCRFPPKTAQHIISEISTEMLIFFEARYSFLKVACRRRKQFKADIIILLSIFKWLMLFIVETPGMYLRGGDSRIELWHALCNKLFHLVVITCSPLLVIINYFSDNTLDTDSTTIDWLSVAGSERYVASNSLLLVFEILVKQPVVNHALLEIFLGMDDGLIPVLLIEFAKYLRVCVPADSTWCDTTQWNGLLEEARERSIVKLEEDILFQNLYTILMRLPFRQPFLMFMSKLIEQDNSKSFKITCTEGLPTWLVLITNNLKSVLKHILNPALDLLIHDNMVGSSPQFVFTNVHTLPCGCQTQPLVDEKKFPRNAMLLHKCLIMTLDALVENIVCIPSIIWDIFPFIKQDPNVNSSWTKQTQLGTKILACLLFNWLCERENLEFFSCRCTITESTYSRIAHFAELLWHVVYNLTHNVTDNRSISMDINKDMQKSADAVRMKLNILAASCNVEMDFVRQSSAKVTDFILENDYVHGADLQTNKCMDSLSFVTDVLKENEPLMRDLLSNTQHELSEGVKNSLTNEDSEPVCNDADGFNPVLEFDIVGHKCLDHFQVLEEELDWASLMQGIPRDLVSDCISNRFEFQDQFQNILLEDEVRDVAALKLLLLNN